MPDANHNFQTILPVHQPLLRREYIHHNSQTLYKRDTENLTIRHKMPGIRTNQQLRYLCLAQQYAGLLSQSSDCVSFTAVCKYGCWIFAYRIRLQWWHSRLFPVSAKWTPDPRLNYQWSYLSTREPSEIRKTLEIIGTKRLYVTFYAWT